MTDIISGIASNVLTNLGSRVLNEVASVWHFKPELHKLNGTVKTIRDVLDAHEDSQGHRHKNLIDRLQDAVHDADDLIDRFTTLNERKRIMISSSRGRFTKEVQLFFSRDNQVSTAIKISREIKRIRKTLDNIIKDRDDFVSMFPSKDLAAPSGVVKMRETWSHVVTEEVIGKDDDKKKILDISLGRDQDHHDDSKTANVLVLPIVGVGGLGKTTIAQLVFNDVGVKNHFQIMEWVCIGDEVLGVGNIVKRIIRSTNEDQILEHIKDRFQEKFGGKRYLIVLDDVWEENPIQLLDLRSLLSVGEKGSTVIVTTRSMLTAKRIGTVPHMDLQFLSDEASWTLFAKVAFEDGQQEEEQLVRIGKEIVKKCGNLPLAIKVVASLLKGEDENKWRFFKDHDLVDIDAATDIMPILKLSYSRLRSPLKQCFIYCSLFPKDTEIYKMELCHQWMAQGFITSSSLQKNSEECLEDTAEQCFMELLHRSFFQDIRRDKWGEIVSFKMHDLIHDLAKDVAGKETLIVDGDQIGLVPAGTRYLSIGKADSTPNLPSALYEGANHLRTLLQRTNYFYAGPRTWDLSDLFSCFQCIKVLDLHSLEFKELPDSIGRLIHLRYLDLSHNDSLELLPRSFTRLHNLETLFLNNCRALKELPQDFSKLVNLQSLDIRHCQLSYMPPGMGNLTRLRRVTEFVLGFGKFIGTDCHFKPCTISASGMDDLLHLGNLRGSLNIEIKRMAIRDSMSFIATEAGCLLNKSDLVDVEIRFNPYEGADASQDEQLLRSLQPHSNLRSLVIRGYGAENFPSWSPMNDLSLVLPNLVSIQFWDCQRCQHLPILSQLPSLKSLKLRKLTDLECIESNYSYEASTSVTFFPSLEVLWLFGLPNVKGWWTPEISGTTGLGCDPQHSEQRLRVPSFPRLSTLKISGCPNMTTMPLCPSVEELDLSKFNERLHLTVMETDEQNSAAPLLNPTSSSSTAMSSSSTSSRLADLCTDNINYLHQLPKSCLHSLVRLRINKSKGATLLSRSFWQHLTLLEDLEFSRCDAYDHQDKEETDEISWRSLRRLRRLNFLLVSNLTTLPKGIRYLTNLQSLSIFGGDNLVEVPEWISQLSSSLQRLTITGCPELKALPEGIRDLTSLRFLNLRGCRNLVERCRKSTGEDWPKIRHVPCIKLPDGDLVRIDDNSV